MTAIKMMLRAAILTGAIALLPAVAAADGSQPDSAEQTPAVPDHAQAEARSMGPTTNEITAPVDETPGVPDHAQAEARGAADEPTASTMSPAGIPDHAAAEARTADVK